MARAPRQIGDKVVIGAVDGTTGLKKYELVPARNNYSYRIVSDQSEVQPEQALNVSLNFHGGIGYSNYNERTAGYIANTGLLASEPGVIQAPISQKNASLSGAANPPMYFFETTVNDGGADDGQPVLYIIANETAEVNVYKLSLDSGDISDLLVTKTFSVTPTQPCGSPAEWNDGSNTRWYLGLGDSTNRIQRLDSVVSGTAADTWTASSDADARHLKVVGNRLMRSTNENQISLLPRAGNPLTEASWGSDFFVGDASSNITELGEAGGLAYIAKSDGFYEWDTVGEASNILPEIGKAPRNGQGMIYWHGGFVIPAASALWWTRTGKPIGPDSNPEYRANHPGVSAGAMAKHGQWMGLAAYGEHLYGLYVTSAGTQAAVFWGRERDVNDPPGWGPLVWHAIGNPVADRNDFHGVFIAETSEFGATDVRPTLWAPSTNDIVRYKLDRDGGPISRGGDIDLQSGVSPAITLVSGNIQFGTPSVLKQLRVIDGWAEDFKDTNDIFRLRVIRDGGSAETVGANITADGYFERFWTQDSNDTARQILVVIDWLGTGNSSTDGPRLRDVTLRAVALPDTAQVWTFNFYVRDDTVRTAKVLRSELEGYLQDLKQYELPDADTINGVMTSIRLLRADEINELFADMQPPPKYVLQAQVREMVSA